MLFLLLNFFLVSFLSTLEFQPEKDTLLDINFEFNILRTVTIIVIVTLLQIVLLYLGSYQMINNEDMVQIYPEKQINNSNSTIEEIHHNYDLEEIETMVHEVAEKMNVQIDRIFITSTPIPNAFTFTFPGIGSIVNLNTNIMDFLSKKEIKAIIAHEIGHIKEHDSLQKLIATAPSTFIHISVSYFYLLFVLSIFNSLLFDFDLLQTILRVLIFIMFLLITRGVIYLSKLLISKSERSSEMICDLHAASITTPVITINMLLHLGQRVETINTLMKEYTRMEKKQRKILTQEDQRRLMHLVGDFPLYEIDEEQARIYAPFLYILSQLQVLKDIYRVPLKDEQIYKLATESAMHHIDIGNENQKKIEQLTSDWREFDINKDQMLSENELIGFIDKLKSDKRKFLFSNEIYVDRLVQEHPDFRRRILNVYEIKDQNS